MSFIEKYKKKIYVDSLTGIGNPQMLTKFYNSLKSKVKNYAYVYVHINNFSNISKTFGHETGNQLIKDVALCLKLILREGEIACHINANIYALLLKFDSRDQFSKRLELMINSLEKLKIKNFDTEMSYSCKFRCGVYQISDEKMTVEDVANMAKIAHTTAKQENLGDFAFFDKGMQEKIQFRSNLLASAKEAIELNQIVPYFQTKHDVQTRTVCGAEVLARWKHPEFGVISPRDFIPVLEATGNILQLDLYMIEETCKLLKKWFDEENMPVPLSVNISKFNLYEPNFADKVIGLIREYDVPANMIDFEVNGDSLLGHEEKAFDVAQTLSRQGFMLTIDNFGKDAIPMELISKLPINMLNINAEFLQRAEKSDTTKSVLSSIIELAHKLDIMVCAIAIETEHQDGFLAEMGCDFTQGNLYAEVIPQNEFEKVIF